mmetsp:Transcript_11197/g.25104  ORF Transcript_11197/g.25104 Transcript_11197/m.25104 type:complete len:249 (+) Transcript_11197:596-1342(+)
MVGVRTLGSALAIGRAPSGGVVILILHLAWVEELIDSFKHVLVAPIVTDGKHEVNLSEEGADLVEYPRNGHALVDTAQLHLYVAGPLCDIHLEAEEQVLEVGAQLLSLPGPEVLISIAVLPHQGAALVFDAAALSSLHELLHDLKGIRLPRIVCVGIQTLPVVPRLLGQFVVEAAFCSQPYAVDIFEPVLQHLLVASAEDDNGVPVVLAQGAQATQNLAVGRRTMAFEVRDIALGRPIFSDHISSIGC